MRYGLRSKIIWPGLAHLAGFVAHIVVLWIRGLIARARRRCPLCGVQTGIMALIIR